jgi:hypothetical protein
VLRQALEPKRNQRISIQAEPTDPSRWRAARMPHVCNTDSVTVEDHTDQAPRPRRRVRTALWGSGILVALAIAIIPPLLDPSKSYVQVGIIVGLVGVCIGLLIEQTAKADRLASDVSVRLHHQAELIANSISEITPVVAAPPPCKKFVFNYVKFYQDIDPQRGVAVFADIQRSKSAELIDCLRDLSNGAVTVNVDGPFSIRARSFDDVLRWKAVSMGPFEFWDTPFGKRYFETQRSAIERLGLAVERIFVFDDAADPRIGGLVAPNIAVGVDTWVVARSWVSDHNHQHVVDQGVLTFRNGTKLLVQPRSSRGRHKADVERLSVIPSEIHAAEFSLSIVQSNAVKVTADSPWSPH